MSDLANLIGTNLVEIKSHLTQAQRLFDEIEKALLSVDPGKPSILDQIKSLPSRREGLQPPVRVIPDLNDVVVPIEGDLDPPPPPRYDHDTHGWDDPFADVVERPVMAPGSPPPQPRTPVRPPPSIPGLGIGPSVPEAQTPAQPKPAAPRPPAGFIAPTGKRWMPPRPQLAPRPPAQPRPGFVAGLAAEQKEPKAAAFQKPRLPAAGPKQADDDGDFPGDKVWDRSRDVERIAGGIPHGKAMAGGELIDVDEIPF